MTIFYVATRARYVVVDAPNESEARRLGQPALQDLHADLGKQIGRNLPVEIHVVRPATSDEIEMWQWHEELLGQ